MRVGWRPTLLISLLLFAHWSRPAISGHLLLKSNFILCGRFSCFWRRPGNSPRSCLALLWWQLGLDLLWSESSTKGWLPAFGRLAVWTHWAWEGYSPFSRMTAAGRFIENDFLNGPWRSALRSLLR